MMCRLFLLVGLLFAGSVALASEGPNVLLIAVDDMGYGTPVSFGGRVDGLTPAIDSLASRGMSFTSAYNTSSRCAPSRGSIMTGHYQDNYNERPGTSDTTVRTGILTIPEYLRPRGYMTGLFGKDTHYRPLEKYGFDQVVPMAAMAVGRSPELYAKNISEFIDKAIAEDRPFFVSANTHDPHRPYAGAPGEREAIERRFAQEVAKRKEQLEFVVPPEVETYSQSNFEAPGFVPDHALVREEFGYYLNSAHRADQFVGALMQVLEDRDLLDNTLVIFHSDNGMHWPFAKSNVYVASVKTPFIVYWQGHVMADTTSDSLVSMIDILPTILEAAGVPVPGDLPGKSLLPLLKNPELPQHDAVFATINAKGEMRFEMRSVIDREHIYIYNKWADGTAKFYDGRYGGGLALKGMEAAAVEDEEARARLEFFYDRASEELYDIRTDPDALENLVGRNDKAAILQAMRASMRAKLATVDDPYQEDFRSIPVLCMNFETARSCGPTDELLRHEKLILAPGTGVDASVGLRAEYRGYHRGSQRIVKHLPLPAAGQEFSLNYDVRFDPDFQFVQGGKLLGMGPKKHVTGGRPIVPEGWSTRVMFRTGGVPKLYTYHQDMKGQYGDGGVVVRPFRFEKGRFYSVSLHVRVNDGPDVANGFARLYVNGELIERHENLRLRGVSDESSLINKFMFSSFHGGHEPRWAPRDADGNYATVHATFDNISVYEGERVRPAPGH